ncbi:MAG: protein kinase [Gemmatimonadaceae bacterium]
MSTKDPLNLDPLATDYDVLGELSGRDDARTFLGKRKSDDVGVLITVSASPPDDEGNALSHLAADANLLASRSHRNVLRVLEGRWVGTDAFAVVTARTSAPTLEELLTRRDEEFGFPRIAAILRQINAALEWSRSQKVVHRSPRLDTIFVEPGSDNVSVAFTVTPLAGDGVPGAEEDGITIVRVARAMLTRSPIAPEREKRPLAELRPGLPARVLEQTDALLNPAAGSAPLDVTEYIAAIAMSEELKRGEVELARVMAEVSEEQRTTREQLGAERQAHESDLAEQARVFATEKEDFTRAFEREKETAARALEREKDSFTRSLAKEREELHRAVAKERDEHQRALAREQAKLAKEREQFTRERASFERTSARARDQIAKKLAALDAQTLLFQKTAELPVPDREVIGPVALELAIDSSPADFDELYAPEATEAEVAVPDQPYDEIVDAPVPGAAAAEALPPLVNRDPWWRRMWEARTRRSMSLVVVGVASLVGVSAVALLASRAGPAPDAQTLANVNRVTDSAAGAIAGPYVVPNITPTTSVDSLSLVRPRQPLVTEQPQSPAETPPAQPHDPLPSPVSPAPGFQPWPATDSVARDTARPSPVSPSPRDTGLTLVAPVDSALRRQITAPVLPLVRPRADSQGRPDSAAVPPRP